MQKNIKSIVDFFHRPIFTDKRVLFGVWMIAAVLGCIDSLHNNFKIFRGVFWHTVNQVSLFAEYPAEYFDMNHYGPLFSIIIAPFAIVPMWLGIPLWSIFMTLILYKAVETLPFSWKRIAFIYWFCLQVLIGALQYSQFNVIIAAIIILSFVFIEKEKDIWATLMIAIGTFVKLYGIVGLAFFFFSKHKGKFILSLIGWSIVCYVLPMLISSPEYVNSQYAEWLQSLIEKNGTNQESLMQNVSLLGMVHKISRCWFSDLYLIIPGMVLFALPYLRFKQYRNLGFRLGFLASTMLFTVLFSTGSETCTYIIAFVGVCIWYYSASRQRSKFDVALMIFAFVLSSMAPSDLFPAYIRVHFVRPYALYALPCTIIWCKLIYEMLVYDYSAVSADFREG